jgi:MFS family permease
LAGKRKVADKFSFLRDYRLIALFSITIARGVYALNWYTLAPGLPQVSRDFGISTADLGILESAFLEGAGIFQIPSTIGAARFGPKSICVAGMLLMGGSNILCGFANSFSSLVLLRLIAGVGASMFFAPAIAVVTELFQGNRQGLAIGLYNSAFSIGGSIAFFGWGYIDSIFDWRGGVIIGGILAAALGIENQVVIRKMETSSPAKPLEAAIGVLRNRQVWLLSVGLIGVWASYYVVGQLLPFFEETIKHVAPGAATLMTAQIFLWPIPASLLGGYLSDRFHNRRQFMLIPSILFGIATALVGYLNFFETFSIMILLGILDAFIFTALYASVYQMLELNGDQKIISISLMNSVQITGAFVGPILFAYFASTSYSLAWLAVGTFVLPFCVALVIAREPFKLGKERRKGEKNP